MGTPLGWDALATKLGTGNRQRFGRVAPPRPEQDLKAVRAMLAKILPYPSSALASQVEIAPRLTRCHGAADTPPFDYVLFASHALLDRQVSMARW